MLRLVAVIREDVRGPRPITIPSITTRGHYNLIAAHLDGIGAGGWGASVTYHYLPPVCATYSNLYYHLACKSGHSSGKKVRYISLWMGQVVLRYIHHSPTLRHLQKLPLVRILVGG